MLKLSNNPVVNTSVKLAVTAVAPVRLLMRRPKALS